MSTWDVRAHDICRFGVNDGFERVAMQRKQKTQP